MRNTRQEEKKSSNEFFSVPTRISLGDLFVCVGEKLGITRSIQDKHGVNTFLCASSEVAVAKMPFVIAIEEAS